MANLVCDREFQKLVEETKNYAGERAVGADLSSLIISSAKLRDVAIAHDDCITGSHSGVKRINPPRTPRKAPIPLDTPVGKYIPKPQRTQPRRNLNLKEAPIPLDIPVEKP